MDNISRHEVEAYKYGNTLKDSPAQDLNIMPEHESLPVTLVIDGQIVQQNLSKMNINLDWLQSELLKSGVHSLKQVLFATLDSRKQLYLALMPKTPYLNLARGLLRL